MDSAGQRAARALVAQEAIALRQLREVVKSATQRVVYATVVAPDQDRRRTAEWVARTLRSEGGRLASEMETAVNGARLATKKESLRVLGSEWERTRRKISGLGLLDPGPLLVSPALAANDEVSAAQAGQAFASAWSSAILAAVWQWADAAPANDVARTIATVDVDARVRRIAATEPARAFADAFDEGAGWLVEQHRGATWLPALLKRWEAANDRKVCPACRGLDGELQILGRSFPGGLEPGYTHPFCRCVPVLVFLPVRLRETPEAGRQVDDENPRSPLEPVKEAA